MLRRLPALDGWRAIGALMVIASHLQAGGYVNLQALGSVAYGRLGVEYFFGISGFVIARQLLADDGPTLASFYVRRFFRIVPPLVLYVSFIWLLSRERLVEPHAQGVVRALTFTCNLKSVDCGGWLGDHTWSLSVEEQFYLAIPVALAVIKPRWIVAVLTGAIGPLALALRLSHHIEAAAIVSDFTVIGFGVLCALYEPLLQRFASRVPAWTAVLAAAGTIAVVFLPASAAATLLAYLGLAPMILFVLIVSAFRGGWITTMMGRGPLPQLGLVSYSLYLWQQLATRAYPGDSLAAHVAAVAACIAFAFASYYWIEKPLMRLGRHLGSAASSAFERTGASAKIAL